MIDPEQLLSQYEGRLAQARAKSDAIRENLANLHVTERAGNLVGLQLGQALQREDSAVVAQDIMRTVQAAYTEILDDLGWKDRRELKNEEDEKEQGG